MGIGLFELYIAVTVPVLNVHDFIANACHSGEIALFHIMDELVDKVKIIGLDRGP